MEFILWACLFQIIFISHVQGDCDKGCDLPINLYEQLKCTPKYGHSTDCCPIEYDCSNIFIHTDGMCHLRGRYYKPEEYVPTEAIAESCVDNQCQCGSNSEFNCALPNQICHEHYLSDYPKKDCYLQYPLDRCCASNEKCPPFDNVAKCEVNGKIYKEGQRFPHPEKKCTKCVCTKDFDGKFTEPACQMRNCTTEIKYSKEIHNYCAPFYIGGTCCPAWWICPETDGQYIPAPKVTKHGAQCKFGEKLMDVGSKYLYQNQYTAKTICECIVPPFLSCSEQGGE